MSTDTDFNDKMIERAAQAALVACGGHTDMVPHTSDDVKEGAPFTIPLVVPTGVESGDNRLLLNESLSSRIFPLPLMWQVKTDDGHKGSYIVGRIDSAEITPEGIKNAKGVFDIGPWGREAERMVRGKFLRGVSVDLDKFKTLNQDEMSELSEQVDEDIDDKTLIKEARQMGVTLVAKPAFQECFIVLDEDLEEVDIVDGIHTAEVDLSDDIEGTISTLIAGAIPIKPPYDWFRDPKLKAPTPLTVDEGGRVFGHIATWTQDHISYNNATRPPRSKSNYAYFHTGIVRTDNEEDVAVGQLTMAGGHADVMASAENAVKHYDDTASAVADVHAGEDAYGIWVAGALRPGVSPEQIRVLRASAPSGDWRPINNRLEMVAVLQVNVPGFPVARACVASGVVTSLVAAGAADLYRMKQDNVSSVVTELSEKVDRLERKKLEEQKEIAVSTFNTVREERKQALVASAADLRARLAPELSEREERHNELVARKEALSAEFSLRYKAGRVWDESEHPRYRNGRFRNVLLRLNDLFDGHTGDPDDKDNISRALQRAADAQDSGNDSEALDAGKEVRGRLDKMIEDTDSDNPRRKNLVDVLEEVDKAINTEEAILDDRSKPGPVSDSISEELEEALAAFIEFIIDELGEGIDPQTVIDRAFAQLKQMVDDSFFENPEDVVDRIADIVEKRLKPGLAQ